MLGVLLHLRVMVAKGSVGFSRLMQMGNKVMGEGVGSQRKDPCIQGEAGEWEWEWEWGHSMHNATVDS